MNRWMLLPAFLAGVLLMLAWQRWQPGSEGGAGDMAKPLYWVAPMDPNYRRDGPGKSPMGMDLVPVYAEDAQADSPGTVRITAEVMHNLGVRTAQVRRGRLPTTLRTVGYVQVDEDRIRHVHTRVEGWIERLHVRAVGDPVVQGQPLYSLYSPLLVTAQEELLLALDSGSERLLRAAEARLRALDLPSATIASLQRDREVRRTVVVPVPQSGVINALQVREGYFAKPDMTLLDIVALDPIWVVGEIFEAQAGQISVGDAVEISVDALPERRWQSQVDLVYPNLDAGTRTVRVRSRIDNADGALRPNMYAQLRIDTQPGSSHLLVPREALIRVAGQTRVVLALGEGRFKSIAVEPGQIGEREAEVRSGLRVGDRVVVSAQFLLDSESSRQSDFQRIDGAQSDQTADRQWLSAEIRAIDADAGTLKLRHGPVAAWQWPAMTMDFPLADGVSVDALEVGQAIAIEVQREAGGRFPIVAIDNEAPTAPMQSTDSSGSTESLDHGSMDRGAMDHGAMDHGSLDHGSLDHGSMDHGAMDHGAMDHGAMDHGSMGHGSEDSGADPQSGPDPDPSGSDR